MPAKELEELEKVPIRFYKKDLDWVRSAYPNFGYNRLVRNMLRRFRLAAERQETPNVRPGSDADLEALGLLDGESSADSSSRGGGDD